MTIEQCKGGFKRRASPVLQARVCAARALGLALGACFCAAPAWSANFADATVANGIASASQNGNILTIANSNGAILDWAKFGIAAGETVKFDQASASSSVLNRVLAGGGLSAIYGTLSSNGRVFLINPAGIMVGAGGVVDTAGFVASTLSMRNSDFLAGKLTFGNPGEIGGDVTNQGKITTPTGGFVYLVGSNVTNEGIINTPKGEVILAAGETVSLIDTSTPGIKVDITGAAGNTTNLGEIAAEAGRIGMAGVIVKNSGILNASSAVEEGGRIFLKASQDTYVDKAARIVATGSKGGSVEVLGNRVAVMDQAQIDVSGVGAGGTALIGGDYQGKNPDIQNSQVTWFGPEATIKADATDNGNGGKVIVWADDTTRAYGNISAKGGANGGDGGFVETSGHRYLDVQGINVGAGATAGANGMWLLDPNDISVTNGTGSSLGGGSSQTFAPGTTTSITDGTINATLNSGTDVVIQTSGGGSGGNGDILFASAASISNNVGTRTLTLNAYRNIDLQGSVATSSTGALTLVLNPGMSGSGKVATSGSNTFLLNGAGGPLVAQIQGGKTWDNYGTVTELGQSRVELRNSAVFNNQSGAIFNATGTDYPVVSYNTVLTPTYLINGSVFNNAGTFNYNQTGAAQAITRTLFNNSGLLSITGGTSNLSLENAGTLGGTINIPSGRVLRISEYQGDGTTPITFSNTSITGTGTLWVGNSTVSNGLCCGTTPANPYTHFPVTFNGVSATGIALNLDSKAQATITGEVAFGSIAFNDSFSTGMPGKLVALSNGSLGIVTGNFTIPGGIAYSGNVGFLSGGNLAVGSSLISTGGNVTLVAGWDGASISSPVVTSGIGTIGGSAIITAPNLKLVAGDSINMTGYSVVDHVVASATTGSIAYNSAASTAHIDSATAGTTVSLTSTASNAIALGTVTGSSVTVTAGGAILDDNGVGATNITTSGNIFLTSTNGGSNGGLAISTDTAVSSGTGITANVSGGSYGGIEVRNQSGTPYSVSMTDGASNNKSAHFHNASPFATSSLTSLSLSAPGGVVKLSSDGSLSVNSSIALSGSDIGIQSTGTLVVSSALSSSANIALASATALAITAAVSSTAGDVYLLSFGNLDVSAPVSAYKDALLLGNNISILSGGSVSTTTGDIGMLAFNTLNIGGAVTAGHDALLVGGKTVNVNAAVTAQSVGVIGGFPSFDYYALDAIPFQTVFLDGAVNIGASGSLHSTAYEVAVLAKDISINGGSIHSANDAHLGARNNIYLNNGASVVADDDVYLALFSGNSKLYINELATGQSPSYIWAKSPDTINIAFWGLGSGGVVINGVETTTTAGSSGFFAGIPKTAASQGQGLNIFYGNAKLDSALVNNIVKGGDGISGNIDRGNFVPGTGGSGNNLANNGHTAGGGDDEFGGKGDKDQNGDKDKKPDNKSGKKRAAQCGKFS